MLYTVLTTPIEYLYLGSRGSNKRSCRKEGVKPCLSLYMFPQAPCLSAHPAPLLGTYLLYKVFCTTTTSTCMILGILLYLCHFVLPPSICLGTRPTCPIRPIRSLSYTPSKTKDLSTFRPSRDPFFEHRDTTHKLSLHPLPRPGPSCLHLAPCIDPIRYSGEPAPRIRHGSMHRTSLSPNHHLYSIRGLLCSALPARATSAVERPQPPALQLSFSSSVATFPPETPSCQSSARLAALRHT